MKLRPSTDDREVIPSRIWEALKVSIRNTGLTYGVNIEFDGDREFKDEISRIYREALGK